MLKLVDRAAAETDRKKQAELWKEYQVAMVDQANLIMLFQPIFRVGVRNEIKAFPLTAAGWKVELFDVKRG
jgi:peptide/nickel transport system substrate-binding protein